MAPDLRLLAEHHGLTLAYDDPFGETGPRPVPDRTLLRVLHGLGVDPGAAASGPGAVRRMTVPRGARCWLPPDLHEAPGWGIFCQLYELRSDRNWGIGDFADLAQLAGISGAVGADFLGINPVHALFLADPDRRSPFSPSNRRFLNPLYIAPDLIEGVEVPEGVVKLREAEMVDYPAVAGLKIGALRRAFDRGVERAARERFARDAGAALRLHALFEAISAPGSPWQVSQPPCELLHQSGVPAGLTSRRSDLKSSQIFPIKIRNVFMFNAFTVPFTGTTSPPPARATECVADPGFSHSAAARSVAHRMPSALASHIMDIRS